MSEERRKRQQRRERQASPKSRIFAKKTIVLVALVAVVAGLGVLVKYRYDHRYDAFAKCLSNRRTLMYGAYWCPHCAEQEALFRASFKYAPYIECGVKGDLRAEQQVCKDAGIKRFPTWQFPPVGERYEGNLSLQELSDRTGCGLP